MADPGNHDTTAGAAADDTAVVPSVPAHAASEFAWSSEDRMEEVSRRPWGHAWRNAGIVLAAAVLLAVGIGVFGLLTHYDVARPAGPATPVPVAQLPSPQTVTVTGSPPLTVTAEAPSEPKLEGADAKFISFLRTSDMQRVYAGVSNASAIANARLICIDKLRHNGFQNVAENLGLSDTQVAWFADTASANYCPRYGGSV